MISDNTQKIIAGIPYRLSFCLIGFMFLTFIGFSSSGTVIDSVIGLVASLILILLPLETSNLAQLWPVKAIAYLTIALVLIFQMVENLAYFGGLDVLIVLYVSSLLIYDQIRISKYKKTHNKSLKNGTREDLRAP